LYLAIRSPRLSEPHFYLAAAHRHCEIDERILGLPGPVRHDNGRKRIYAFTVRNAVSAPGYFLFPS
jgi:hypothetical protein